MLFSKYAKYAKIFLYASLRTFNLHEKPSKKNIQLFPTGNLFIYSLVVKKTSFLLPGSEFRKDLYMYFFNEFVSEPATLEVGSGVLRLFL
jgi:hypothetical protein